MIVNQKPIILVEARRFWENREVVSRDVLCDSFELVYAPNLVALPELSECVVAVALADARCGKEIMESLPNLKTIARNGTGYDNVDIAEARNRDIVVTRVSKMNAVPVSEFAISLLLSLSRNIFLLHSDMAKGVWEKRYGMALADMSVGIVGIGSIGQAVISKLNALGVKKIFGWNRSRRPELLSLAEKFQVELVDLPKLMSESDAVIVAVALAPETNKFLDTNMLSLMKPTSYLINVSRGAVVDEDALADLVVKGKIGGVGLDVFSQEPPFAQAYMKKLIEAGSSGKNVIISPHNASITRNAHLTISLQVAKNILAVLEGKLEGIEVL